MSDYQNISATVDSWVKYHILFGESSRLKLIAKGPQENYDQKFAWSTERILIKNVFQINWY